MQTMQTNKDGRYQPYPAPPTLEKSVTEFSQSKIYFPIHHKENFLQV
jgi:hypothetical protein